MEMDDSTEMIDLTGMSDRGMMTDAELAEKLQMEELETLNQSDFEVAQHLQEMERQNASHMIPDHYLFRESMRRAHSGYRPEPRRCRPPRPPPPWPTQAPRTSNSDEHNPDSCEPSVDNASDDVNPHYDRVGVASAAPSRFSLARKAQNAINRNRRDPVVPPDDAGAEPDRVSHAADLRDSAAAASAEGVAPASKERVIEAMHRNRRGRFASAPGVLPVANAEQSRPTFYRTRSRDLWNLPVPDNAPADADDLRDALDHDLADPTPLIPPLMDATGDVEQQGRAVAPPVPPRRHQRRPHRNRRMHDPTLNPGFLQFSLRPIADYHETLEMPGWAPVRRHYEYSRMLDNDDGSGNNYEALWALSEQIGDAANKGLNLIQITRLPTMTYKAPSSTVTSDDTTMTSDDTASGIPSSEPMSDAALAGLETVCRVCLGGFENGEVLRALPCCHRFHIDCIDQWIKQNAICPVCRDSIKDHFRGGGGGGGGDHWNHHYQ